MQTYRILRAADDADDPSACSLVRAHLNRDGSVARISYPVLIGDSPDDLRKRLAHIVVEVSVHPPICESDIVGDRDFIDLPF